MSLVVHKLMINPGSSNSGSAAVSSNSTGTDKSSGVESNISTVQHSASATGQTVINTHSTSGSERTSTMSTAGVHHSVITTQSSYEQPGSVVAQPLSSTVVIHQQPSRVVQVTPHQQQRISVSHGHLSLVGQIPQHTSVGLVTQQKMSDPQQPSQSSVVLAPRQQSSIVRVPQPQILGVTEQQQSVVLASQPQSSVIQASNQSSIIQGSQHQSSIIQGSPHQTSIVQVPQHPSVVQVPPQQLVLASSNPSITVTVSSQASGRTPYHYTKMVHHVPGTGSARQFQTVVQHIPVTSSMLISNTGSGTVQHIPVTSSMLISNTGGGAVQHIPVTSSVLISNAGGGAVLHQGKSILQHQHLKLQQSTVVAHSRNAAQNAPYVNQRVLVAGNCDTQDSSSPKCYLGSHFLSNKNNSIPSLVTSVVVNNSNGPNSNDKNEQNMAGSLSELGSSSNNGENSSSGSVAKSPLAVVLQDHNYMAPLPPANSQDSKMSSKVWGSSSQGVMVSGVNTTVLHSFSPPGVVNASPHTAVHSPSRTYSFHRNKSNTNSGTLIAGSSGTLNRGVTSNTYSRVISNQLTSSARPSKAITYSVPRQQQRYSTMSQQQQLQYSSPLKGVGKTAVQHRTIGVLHTAEPKASSSYIANISSPVGGGQRYTYRRSVNAMPAVTLSSTVLGNAGITSTTISGGHPTPVMSSSVLSTSLGASGRAHVYNSPSVHNTSNSVNNIAATIVGSINNSNAGLANSVLTSRNIVNSTNNNTHSNTNSGLNNNINILINNKMSVINKTGNIPSNARVISSSSPSTSPTFTYIPSPHIPPPPGSAPMVDYLAPSSGSLLSSSSLSMNSSGSKESPSKGSLPRGTKKHHLLGKENQSDDLNRSGLKVLNTSSASNSSDDEKSSSPGPSGEETETAPEGEGDEMEQDDSITRCVCDFTHDDGYMIQCDRCQVWQHVVCMGLSKDNIPEEYLCEACHPRSIDKLKAHTIQLRKRDLLAKLPQPGSSSDSDDNCRRNKNKPTKGMPGASDLSRPKLTKKKKPRVGDKIRHNSGNKSKAFTNHRNIILNKNKKITKKSNNTSGGSNQPNNNNSILSPTAEEKDKKICKRRRKSSSSAASAGGGGGGGEYVGQLSPLHSCSTTSTTTTTTPPLHQQLTYSDTIRGWVEGYEAAITNHYSPELRARVHAARINGISPHLRASVQGAVLGHRCKVVHNNQPQCLEFEKKVLVAGCAVTSGTALLEYQGKYLLWSQWCANNSSNKCGSGGDRFLPFTLRYTLLQEGLSVAVDARTYGNEARFARRSCQPNAQVRHVVERGSLHLYLVATQDIEEGGEILLPLHTCNTTEASYLPPCPSLTHDHICPYVNSTPASVVVTAPATRPQDLPLEAAPAVVPMSPELATASPPEVPSYSPSRPQTPMSPVRPNKTTKLGGLASPLKSPSVGRGSMSPTKASVSFCKAPTSPVKAALSPVKGDVSPKVEVIPFNGSGEKSPLRVLAASPSPHSSPDRDSRKSFGYGKRSWLTPRGNRRTVSESSSCNRRKLRNSVPYTSDDGEEEDESHDEDNTSIDETHLSLERPSRRVSEGGEIPSSSPRSFGSSPRKRMPSSESRGKRSSDLSSDAGPSARLRNNSGNNSSGKSPVNGGKSPQCSGKSPQKHRSASEADSMSEAAASALQAEKDSKKLTRDEKKIMAYMKAFEMMEKQAQRKQEMDKKREEERARHNSSKSGDGGDEDDDDNSSGDETFRPNDKQRKKSKKIGRTASAVVRRTSLQHRRRAISGPADQNKTRSSCDDDPDSGRNISPLARFPKTKKSMMNDWLNECEETTFDSNTNNLTSNMNNNNNSGVGGMLSGMVGVPSHYMRSTPPSRRSSSSAALSLAASSIRRSTSSSASCAAAALSLAAANSIPGVSAKKRWLRQAISEEPSAASEATSPSHTPDSPPAGQGALDYNTPLKKRRFARESVSETPPLLATPPPPDMVNKMESDVADGEIKVKKEEDETATDEKNEFSNSAVVAALVCESKIKVEDENEKKDLVADIKATDTMDGEKDEINVEKKADTSDSNIRITRKRKRSVEPTHDAVIDTDSAASERLQAEETVDKDTPEKCTLFSDSEEEMRRRVRRDRIKKNADGKRKGRRCRRKRTTSGASASNEDDAMDWQDQSNESSEQEEEDNLVVDDDDSPESGFEGFADIGSTSDLMSPDQPREKEEETAGDAAAPLQLSTNGELPAPSAEKLIASADEVPSVDTNAGAPASKDDQKCVESSEGLSNKTSLPEDTSASEVSHTFDTPRPNDATNSDSTHADNSSCSKAKENAEDLDWRGPRTPEGPAPFSPESKACPRTPSNTPPSSPVRPATPPCPPSPPDSPVDPRPPSPPGSPLPSILKGDTLLTMPSITTLGSTSRIPVSVSLPVGSPLPDPSSRPPLTTLGALDHSPLAYESTSALNSSLPLTTLGDLDKEDLPLSSLSRKRDSVSSDPASVDAAPSTPTKVSAPVKRKLSILEYRKRKSVHCENDAPNTALSESTASTSSSCSPVSCTTPNVNSPLPNTNGPETEGSRYIFPVRTTLSNSGDFNRKSSSISSSTTNSEVLASRSSEQQTTYSPRSFASPEDRPSSSASGGSPPLPEATLPSISSSTAAFLGTTVASLQASRLPLEDGEISDDEEDKDDDGDIPCNDYNYASSVSGSPPSPPSPGTPPPPPPPPDSPPPLQSDSSLPPLPPNSPPHPLLPDSPPQLLSTKSPLPPLPPKSPLPTPPPQRPLPKNCESPSSVSSPSPFSSPASSPTKSAADRGTLADRLKREFGLNVGDEEGEESPEKKTISLSHLPSLPPLPTHPPPPFPPASSSKELTPFPLASSSKELTTSVATIPLPCPPPAANIPLPCPPPAANIPLPCPPPAANIPLPPSVRPLSTSESPALTDSKFSSQQSLLSLSQR